MFNDLYDRAIDFGGHPNPHATFSTIRMGDDLPENSFVTLALVSAPATLQHAMKSVAQVGLTALFIFQHIFKAKFDLLGIRAEMDRLRQTHL